MSVEVSATPPVDEYNARCHIVDKSLEAFAEVPKVIAVLADTVSTDYDGRAVADAGEGKRLSKVVGRVGALITPAREWPDIRTLSLPVTCDGAAAVDVGDLCGEGHVDVEGAVDLGNRGEAPDFPQTCVGIDKDVCELEVLLKEDAHLVTREAVPRLRVRCHTGRD